MTRVQSFTKFEHQIRGKLRKNISSAESTEDVKKFFAYSAVELFRQIFGDGTEIRPDDVQFLPGQQPGYLVSTRLLEDDRFAGSWANSDLPSILNRMADVADHRYLHLEKHREKSNSKIRN